MALPRKTSDRLGFGSFIPQSTAVGLLGGGQLARMLALAAHPLGLKPSVLSENSMDPAAQVTAFHVKGSAGQIKPTLRLLEQVQWVTFESEFVDTDQLLKLPAEHQVKFFPSLFCMKLLQNRASQKTALVDLRLKTAPFVHFNSVDELHYTVKLMGYPLVLKKAFGGYDGYGTFYLRKPKDLSQFLKTQDVTQGWIAERFISFQRELAISAARNQQGEIEFLPLVETRQTQSRCDWVQGPVKHAKLGELKKGIQFFLKKINYVGIIAFELFDCDGELLVNEVAPRVHNSAHYSQDGLNVDQFTLHWMCGLGMKLPKIEAQSEFAMVNLLGISESTISFSQKLHGHLHLYGKSASRPGRKMGHLNLTGKSSKQILSQLLAARKGIRR